jgi:cytochrome c oxidase subunit IV
MTDVIQLSYILRGLLRAAKPTHKKGHSLTIYISLFCWSLLLRQGIYLLKYFLLVYGC